MINFFIIFFLAFISCNNNDIKPVKVNPGCYFLSIGKDTMLVQINGSENAVTGKMLFDNFEKDGSRGVIAGNMYGDTLKAWYNFESEGMRSVMEVIFLVKDSMLVRAQGRVDVKNDTVYFPDLSVISFPEENSYLKENCENHPALNSF